jgi:glutathione S-transferase
MFTAESDAALPGRYDCIIDPLAPRDQAADREELTMAIVMYDLAGADPTLRFSPYCWRIRMALAHKDLPFDTVPWRFTEKDAIAFSGQGRVPVIRDGENVVSDSWKIACYLDAAYPARPSLFGGPAGQAHARLINAWVDSLHMGIMRLVVGDILNAADPKDRDYFRSSREQRLGATLEAAQDDSRAQRLEPFRESLAPVRLVLATQLWLGGGQPSYADHILFGTLQWPRCVSRFELLTADDPLREWQERALDLYGGLGRKACRV